MEVVIAPGYEEAALNRLQQKKNLRVLQMDIEPGSRLLLRSVDGGLSYRKPILPKWMRGSYSLLLRPSLPRNK